MIVPVKGVITILLFTPLEKLEHAILLLNVAGELTYTIFAPALSVKRELVVFKANAPEAVILVAFVFIVPPGEFMVKFVASADLIVFTVIIFASTGELKII